MKRRNIQQQSNRNLSNRQAPLNDTRFIIVGASIMMTTFSQTSSMLSAIESLYARNVEFFNHGMNGATSTAVVGSIDSILNNYTNLPFTDTYVIVHCGGNDVTNSRPYSTASSGAKEALEDNLNFIIDEIEAKGFIPILNDLSFRNYDGTTHDNEGGGSLPYNENIIQPLILSRTPGFAFGDGQSFWQLYTLMYNNYETYLSGDTIHPSETGYAAIRDAFVNTICKYIFTGIPPTKIEKE